MVKTPVIVIKCNKFLNTENMETWHRIFAEQYKSGVLLLPDYCSVEAYPTEDSAYLVVNNGED